MSVRSMRRKIRRMRQQVDNVEAVKGARDYADDPVGYARKILKFEPTPDQIAIAEACRKPPYRVMAISGHKTGKSRCAAWLASWFYDSFRPSRCITTAPTMESVKDIVWAEIRTMRLAAGLGDLQPKAPELSDAANHVCKGITTSTGEGFQGRHAAKMMLLFDEACGIDPVFWQVGRSQVKPEQGHIWIAFLNPTDPTSQAYWEDQSTEDDGSPRWSTVRMDCLRHPNILAQLKGEPPPFPDAVTLPMIGEWLISYGCELRSPGQQEPTDLEWPPNSGRFYREGPEFQARCRGMWPEGGTYAIWSESLCRKVMEASFAWPTDQFPELGVDVARFGDDYTEIHTRWGDNSCEHEARNGWSVVQTAGRVKEICAIYAGKATAIRPRTAEPVSPKKLPIKIDDDGVGGGVVDILRSDGYFVIPVGAGTPSMTGRYPNKRSELWFQLAERARMGKLGMANLDALSRNRLRQQFMTVLWRMHTLGRVVEPKEETKKRLGRSPDSADAANLAYYTTGGLETARYIDDGNQPREPYSIPATRNRMWG